MDKTDRRVYAGLATGSILLASIAVASPHVAIGWAEVYPVIPALLVISVMILYPVLLLAADKGHI